MEFSLGVSRAKPVKYGPRDIDGRKMAKSKKYRIIKKSNKVTTLNIHPKFNIKLRAKNLIWNMGPFWQLPPNLDVSSSVKYKFSLISHIFSYSNLKNAITSNMTNIRFKFLKNIMPEGSYEVQLIKPQIMAYYARQELEWNTVRGLYFGLFKTKRILQPLIYKWRIAKCIKNQKNTEDPVTLEPPKKTVCIIDFKNSMSFIYDANTIRRAIENKILFSDYMFAEPLQPVNLFTNLPLTYGQLMSVILQCKAHGEYSWILEELRARNGNLENFAIFNRVKLNVEAIKVFFKKNTRIIRETVIDFLRTESDYLDLPPAKLFNFITEYDTTPTNTLVRKWINHTREYYIAKELNNPAHLVRIDVETEILLDLIYRMF